MRPSQSRRRTHRDKRPATHSAVQYPLAHESGQRLVDRNDRYAVADGHLTMRLQLGSDRELAGHDLPANIVRDLLVQRGWRGGVETHKLGGRVAD